MDDKNGIIAFQRKDDILIMTISNPPRNRLPDPVFTDPNVLHTMLHEKELRGAILVGEGKNFCEGAVIDNNIPDDLADRMREGKGF